MALLSAKLSPSSRVRPRRTQICARRSGEIGTARLRPAAPPGPLMAPIGRARYTSVPERQGGLRATAVR
jgi:hypothetical protein